MQTEKLADILERMIEVNDEMAASYWNYQHGSDASDLSIRVRDLNDILIDLLNVLIEQQTQPEASE